MSAIVFVSACHYEKPPVSAPTPPPAASLPNVDRLTDSVWVRSGSTDLPGQKLVFLSDGTLIQDSCWETYRLSKWSRETPSRLVWSEDGMDIRADIQSLGSDELILKIPVGPHAEEHRYVPAAVPYVCPDIRR